MRLTTNVFAAGVLALLGAAGAAAAQGVALRTASGQEPRSQQQPEMARLRAEIERMRAKITEIERRLGQQQERPATRAATPSTPVPAGPTRPPAVATPAPVPPRAPAAPAAPRQEARPRAGAGGMMAVPGQGPARLAVPVQPRAEVPAMPERVRVQERRREPVQRQQEREAPRARVERDDDEGGARREVWVIRGGRPFAAGLLGRLRAHRMGPPGGCPMCPHCRAGQGAGARAGRWVEVEPGRAGMFERRAPQDGAKGGAAPTRGQPPATGVRVRELKPMTSTRTETYQWRGVKKAEATEKGSKERKEKIDAPDIDGEVLPIFHVSRRVEV